MSAIESAIEDSLSLVHDNKLAFHSADTDTDTDTGILADFRARIVVRMSACPATSLFSLPQE